MHSPGRAPREQGPVQLTLHIRVEGGRHGGLRRAALTGDESLVQCHPAHTRIGALAVALRGKAAAPECSLLDGCYCSSCTRWVAGSCGTVLCAVQHFLEGLHTCTRLMSGGLPAIRLHWTPVAPVRHLVISPVVISRDSPRSTASAAVLKMPPPPRARFAPAFCPPMVRLLNSRYCLMPEAVTRLHL